MEHSKVEMAVCYKSDCQGGRKPVGAEWSDRYCGLTDSYKNCEKTPSN
jgi:hypothetical protein